MRVDDGGDAEVGIDPNGIALLTQSVSAAAGDLSSVANSLRSVLNSIGLSAGDASSIGDVSAWLSSQIPGLNRRHLLAVAAGQAQPWVTATPGLVWVDEGELDRFPTSAAAAAQAQADAASVKKELGGTLDPATSLDILINENDPDYAVAFANAMGPTALANIATTLNNQRLLLEDNESYAGPDYEDKLATLKQQSTALLQAVDTTFATATRGGAAVTPTWDFADELLKQLPHNAFGLSELLRFGTYDAGFLGTVSNGVYTYEQDNAYGKGYWAGLAPKDQFGGTPYTSDDDHGFYDPMVGVMTALSNNPVAAQAFLNDPDKVKYFTEGRVWTSDQGAAFGAALEAATTTFRDHNPPVNGINSPGYVSAQIASWAIHDLGDNGGRMYDGERGPVGNILASYIADVDAAAFSPGNRGTGVDSAGNSDMPGGQPYGAAFNSRDLSDVMKTSFGDPDSFRTVSAAASAYAETYFNQMAATVAAQIPKPIGASPPDLTYEQGLLLKNATEHAAALYGLLSNSADLQKIDAADTHDENVQTWLDLGDSALELIPLPDSKLAEFAVGEVKDQVFSQLTPHTGDQARSDANDADDQTKLMLKDMAVAALTRNGLYGTGGPATSVSVINSDGSMVSWTAMTQAQKDAYTAWFNTSASRLSDIDTTIVAFFDDGRPGH